jgi:glycosyltransferase involved in cell wall biosynthesis
VTILYFSDTRFPIERANGVQTMATCHALAARGHKVTLIVRPDTTSPARDPFAFYDLPKAPRFRIEPIRGPRSPRARRAQFLLAAVRRLMTRKADVAFTRDLGLAAFFLQLPARRRPPVIYESHGVSVIVSAEMPRLLGKPELEPSKQKLQRLDRRERRVWKRANAYVTITRALRDELTSRYGPRRRLFVVPDGVRLPDAEKGRRGRNDAIPASSPEESQKTTAPMAAYAGHLYPWKGVDTFVQALALTPGIAGLIIGGHPGEGDFARVEGLTRDLGLAVRLTMTGQVPPGEVRARLEVATMLVLPNTKSAVSERYTSPLKLFEYLSMGRPIIGSDLPSIREVLTNEETALLVEAGDADALAGAMSRLASDPELSASLGQRALALAPDYTWERRAERLEDVFEAAVRK